MKTAARRRDVLLLVLSLLAWAPGTAGARDEAESKPPPKIEPGRTIRVNDAKVGAEGYYLIRVPADYTPDRAWPVIFCYHGLGQSPTCAPFVALTGGKGYVIVGMPYWRKGMEGFNDRAADVKNLQRISTRVFSRVNVDKKMMFVGGFSKGGWYASIMVDLHPRRWAGALILGGGGHHAADPGKKVRGMPIFVGVGEKDKYKSGARTAATYYRRRGAKVTFEEWKGLGHRVDTKSKLLRRWLRKVNLLRVIKKASVAARTAQKAKRLGRAYRIYRQLAELSDTHKTCLRAAKLADALAERAKADLAEADKYVAEKQYVQAATALARLSRTYAGSEFGDRADTTLKTLHADPKIREVLAAFDRDAKADALEARAKQAEEKKQYAQAVKLYEQYVRTYPKASRFEEVRKHLDALKADKDLLKKARQQEADKKAGSWMRLAENYISAERPDKAKLYLQRVIDRYGDTAWGPKARARLATLGE